jgi:predicted nucleic acid-binding protein
VFDTNVLFSAAGWQGAPYQCVELARSGATTGVTCAEILDELADKLQTKPRFTAEQALATIADLLTFCRSYQSPAN